MINHVFMKSLTYQTLFEDGRAPAPLCDKGAHSHCDWILIKATGGEPVVLTRCWSNWGARQEHLSGSLSTLNAFKRVLGWTCNTAQLGHLVNYILFLLLKSLFFFLFIGNQWQNTNSTITVLYRLQFKISWYIFSLYSNLINTLWNPLK